MSTQDDGGRIRELNDAFRRTGAGGRLVITAGIAALPKTVQFNIAASVRDFTDFTADNDPYGEHDFGAIDDPQAGRVFWKIDYYDADLRYGSEDPADPAQTTRVLTILLANEY